jgi:subtilase family serine protease
MRNAGLALLPSCNFSAIVLACLLVIASPLLAQQPPSLITQPIDNSVRTVLTGNIHPLARAQYDQGEAPSDLVLHRMMLVLKRSPQQETALRRLIENQQNKKSSSYHQFLTPSEFGIQFGPADSDIATVTNWLQQSGFQVAQVSNGRTVIEFSGTAGRVKQAFGTPIHKYVVNGQPHWANSNNPSIPTALAPVIAGVNSLNGFGRKAQNSRVGGYSLKTRQLTSPKPEFTFGCGQETCYALGPYDFANIYDLLPLWSAGINGTGQTIAIVGDTYINPNDAPTFWRLFGLGTTVNGVAVPMPTLNIYCNGPCPALDADGDEPEADIDTQWSGSVAPGATIDFVTSEDTETDYGIDLSAIYIVDNNVATVMSESYGECEANLTTGGVEFYSYMWEQAAAQGITVMVSTGDNGSAGCDDDNANSPAQDGLNVNGLASSWFNVAVGGTDFNEYNTWSTYWNSTNQPITQQSVKNNTYIPETSWNDSCTNALWITLGTYGSTTEEVCNSSLNDLAPGGGSGGASAAWTKPTWQTGAGVPNDTARDMPDVSLFASNGFLGSFYLICQSDASPTGSCDVTNPDSDLQGYGGTSVASPAFAGIMALVNQKTGSPQGIANLVLYNLISKEPTAFHDVPAGSTNAMPCVVDSPNCDTTGSYQVGVLSGYNTATHYDLVTGLGSVDAANLVNNWTTVSFTPSMTTLQLNGGSAVNITHGAAVTVKVTAAPTSGSGTPTGDVALLVSPGTPGNPGIDWNTLGGGTVSWSTTLLPGGNYKIIAHYDGDTTYGGSYSTPSATVTVNPENSSVSMPGVVTASGVSNSVVYGTGDFDEYLLRADVLNSAGNYCTSEVEGEIACPTGTISFTDNGNVLDASPYKLNSLGYTEDQSIQLTGGSHTLVATYSGDASYKTSNTSTIVTVSKATTAISNLASTLTSVNAGQQFTLTATVSTSSYGVAPTGAVVFLANGTLLTGTVTTSPVNGNLNNSIPASLGASLTTSLSTPGTYAITATYAGDGNYTNVTQSSPPVSIVVATPGFTLSAAPTTVAITPGGPGGTSTITVADQSGFSGSVALAASGLPSGVTASFNPTSTTSTSTLTLTASGSAAAGGPTTVTITGTSGSIMATTTVALTVSQNFTVPATLTNPATAEAGQNTSTTMALAPVGGGNFTSNVTYTCSSGLPTGATCSFSPTQISSGTGGQTVTITVQTAGPFTGAAGGAKRGEAARKLASQKQQLWLPLSLPLAGIVMVGLFGGGLPRRYKIVGLCLALTITGFLVACGGGSSSTPPPAVVTVSPSSVTTLFPNLTGFPAQTQQFSAMVSNSSSQTVTWAVTGGSGNGTIDSTGVYTAPATLPSPANVQVTATSTATTTPGTATVNLQTPTPTGPFPIIVTITEGGIQHTTTFTLTVTD